MKPHRPDELCYAIMPDVKSRYFVFNFKQVNSKVLGPNDHLNNIPVTNSLKTNHINNDDHQKCMKETKIIRSIFFSREGYKV